MSAPLRTVPPFPFLPGVGVLAPPVLLPQQVCDTFEQFLDNHDFRTVSMKMIREEIVRKHGQTTADESIHIYKHRALRNQK